MSTKNIIETFAILKPDMRVDTLDVSPTIYQQLDQRYDEFRNHALIASYQFDSDWSTWEIHPNGDEIVILLSGSCEIVFPASSELEPHALKKSGDFTVVPKNTWHTAKTRVPTQLLFVTPGEATQNCDSPE